MEKANPIDMIQRIIITGTESTGKTALTAKLAAHYKTVFVPDYSREYIRELNREYNQADVIQIAKEIVEGEKEMLHRADKFFFSDNCLINIKIWLQYYKWHVPDWLNNEIVNRRNDLHLLCDIDIAWVKDEQRKNADDRKELFEWFKKELNTIGTNYKIVSGENDKRTEHAIQIIDTFLSSLK